MPPPTALTVYDNDIVIAVRPGRRGRGRPAVPRRHSGPARLRPPPAARHATADTVITIDRANLA